MNRLKKTAAALGALIVLSILANGQHNQTAIIERISDTDISRIEQQSSSESDSRTINVYNDETGKLQTMQLEDYIYHLRTRAKAQSGSIHWMTRGPDGRDTNF